MKTARKILFSLFFVFCFLYVLTSCGDNAKPTSYYINSEGDLIAVLDNGKEDDLGKWGESIISSFKKVTISDDGYYVIDGIKTSISLGESYVKGVSSIEISDDGYYIVNGVKTSISAINVYTVSFDTGFSTKVQDQKIKEGHKVEKPELTRTGYEFDGWFCNDEEWLFNSNVIMDDTTLVAHWTANNYNVKFNNTKGDNPADAIYKFDDNITLPTVATVDGYTFDGWYNDNSKVSNGKWSIVSDVTLTTKWTANNYTVTLDPNGGSVSTTTASVKYGDNFTLPVPTNTFGAFKGWYYGDEKITDASGNSLSPFTYTSNITLTTNWIEEISTVEQLKAIANGLNGHYKLVADIDLENEEWAPIGNATNPFTGVFDGNGHTISNLKINSQKEYVGLFGYNQGDIKNLILSGVNFTIPSISQNSFAGAIVGYNKGTINDVEVSGSLTMNTHSSTYTSYIGGISGYNEGTIKSTINNSSVSGINYVGGITAYNVGTLSELKNKGIINSESYGAGITALTTVSLNNCINEGIITASSYTAGIVSLIPEDKAITISQCKNAGNINTQSHAGGILGYHSGSRSYITISQCINTGNITTSVNDGYLGGIAGFIYSTYISDSYSICDITKGQYIGGILGSGWNGSITNCYTSGNLKPHTRSGGIAGLFYYGSFNECYTNVIITGGGTTGTINANETDGSLLSNCYYSGSGTSTHYLEQGTNTVVHFDKEFYVNSLFWSDEIWDFSGTNYPTLKWESE